MRSRSACRSSLLLVDRKKASGYSAFRAASSSGPRRSCLFNTTRLGISVAPTSANTVRVTSSWDRKDGSEASTTNSNSEALAASSSVDLNDATRSCGSFLINPTVSDMSTLGRVSGYRGRIVVSSVANSLSATSTSMPVIARISEDLPALVYPTRATVNSCSRLARRV